MNLTHEREAISGESFRLTATGFKGEVKIEVFVASTRVTWKKCPDPPCHVMVTVPSGTGGAILHAIAVDSSGDKEEFELVVADYHTESMSADA